MSELLFYGMTIMNIKEICDSFKINQSDLSRRFNIPIRTVQDWHAGRRTPPDYIPKMIVEILENEKRLLDH